MTLSNADVSGNALSLVTNILPEVKNILREFATTPDFTSQMGLAFGEDNNYTDLQQAWLSS
jgi:hypothetical protein